MKDLNTISKNYFGKLKSNLGFKTDYAKSFKNGTMDYYEEMFDTRPKIYQDLINFILDKQDIKNICEIGCSTGRSPIRHKELFEKFTYVGIDISDKSVEYCKNNSKFEFICDDFLKMRINRKFDCFFYGRSCSCL